MCLWCVHYCAFVRCLAVVKLRTPLQRLRVDFVCFILFCFLPLVKLIVLSEKLALKRMQLAISVPVISF